MSTDLEEQVQQWYSELSKNGLKINIGKTEYLECSPQTNGTIHIDVQELKKTVQFKYLGSLVTSDGNTIPDVQARIKWRYVTRVLCDKKIPEYLKAKLYKTVIRGPLWH